MRPVAAALCGFMLTVSLDLVAQVKHFDSENGRVSVEPLVAGLEHPWSLAFLPDGERMLITERPGRLRVAGLDGQLSKPLGGVPDVYARGQGGLQIGRASCRERV